ncbi:RxLR-like protein [Plasmopara halstedii]|uniref:RxLR-like protein n=1 Tax=Plasmopara halstedii TaxID=4781 RepID=A0A0P1B157_PLAHL|nr:RxLR-like protein [Plasmopara halstedii]CEG47437.1 RxLR-like protein [Plasmopara halstedii]|eukprot:XP_024583806.1 RxLR-like protein [Plasmopara halstedii]
MLVLLFFLLCAKLACGDTLLVSQRKYSKSETIDYQDTVHDNRIFLTDDGKRDFNEERTVREVIAIEQKMRKVVETSTPVQSMKNRILPTLKRWLLSLRRWLVYAYYRFTARTKFTELKRLTDKGNYGYDQAIVLGYTPHYAKTMIQYREFQQSKNTKILPVTKVVKNAEDQVVDKLSWRYRQLLGLPGDDVLPVSLNTVWSNTVDEMSTLDRLIVKLSLRQATVLIKRKATAQEMISHGVTPIVYKKALLDMDLLEGPKWKQLKSWKTNPQVNTFLEYLKATRNMPDST